MPKAVKRMVPWAIALAAVILAVANPVMRVTGGSVAPLVSLELNVPDDLEMYSLTGSPVAISPNGSFVAFTANNKAMRRMAFVRATDRTETKELVGTEMATSLFFWSDESAVGVTASDATLRRASLKDGTVVPLARNVDYNSGGTVGSDGTIVYVRERTLWKLPPGGGEPIRLTALNARAQESAQQWPLLLPGGRVVLFTSFSSATTQSAEIDALTLADGTRHTVATDAAFPIYAPPGTLIFLRAGALFAARFDASNVKLLGDPVRVVEHVAVTSSGAPIAAVSGNGTLVYAAADATAGTLVSVSRDGAESPIESTPRSYSAPRLSPDGSRLVVASDGSRLWLQDRTRTPFTLTPLTSPETNTGWPVWTPDGRVLYRSISGVHWIEANGSRRGGTIAGTSQQDVPCAVSPDGNTLAFLRLAPETLSDIYVLSLNGDPKPRPFANTAAFEGGPRFSPDGRWIAYASNESGQFQVYLRAFPGERKIQVSTDGGTFPMWSRDGGELFYRNGHKVMSVRVSLKDADAAPSLSQPQFLFERKYQFTGSTIASYEVSADGRSFIFVKPEPTANQLNVRVNWFGELERRLGGR